MDPITLDGATPDTGVDRREQWAPGDTNSNYNLDDTYAQVNRLIEKAKLDLGTTIGCEPVSAL